MGDGLSITDWSFNLVLFFWTILLFYKIQKHMSCIWNLIFYLNSSKINISLVIAQRSRLKRITNQKSTCYATQQPHWIFFILFSWSKYLIQYFSGRSTEPTYTEQFLSVICFVAACVVALIVILWIFHYIFVCPELCCFFVVSLLFLIVRPVVRRTHVWSVIYWNRIFIQFNLLGQFQR